MSSDNASAEREAASLADVLGRLAAVTVEGTFARASLVRHLERVLGMFEARMGETRESVVLSLRQRLQTLGVEVAAAALFGSAARDELEPDSDIDLLLIGEGLSQLEARAHFKAAGRELRRPVNVVVYSPADWLVGTKLDGSLAHNISANLVVLVFGELPRA